MSKTFDKLPACWTVDQWSYFSKEYDWLFVSNGTLGCTVCRQVSNMHLPPAEKISLAKVWVSGTVCDSGGETKKGQQSSLRTKIREHRFSAAHTAAEKRLLAKHSDSEPIIVAGLSNLSENEHLQTCKIFRTAYHIAKNDRPYTDHPDMVTLQQLNGIDMGRLLQSNVICCNIIEHISGSMRASLVNNMLSSQCHFAVLIDESTSLS